MPSAGNDDLVDELFTSNWMNGDMDEEQNVDESDAGEEKEFNDSFEFGFGVEDDLSPMNVDDDLFADGDIDNLPYFLKLQPSNEADLSHKS